MIALQYELTTYKKFLEDIAVFLGLKIVDNTIHFPEKIGSGFMKLIILPGGVEAILSHFRLNHDFLLERKKDDIEYYTFCCEEIKEVTEFSMTIESDTFEMKEDGRSAMYLTSFLYDVGYSLKSNATASSVRVLLTPEWVKDYLGFDKKEEVLKQYLELKTAGILFKKIDAESALIMNQLLKEKSGQSLLFYHTRILRLMDTFASWLTEEIIRHPTTMNISAKDIERIREIESVLTANFSSPPPTIPELAKSIAISESKLKTLFKTIYSLPPYEYFQKHRMEKARLMLLSKKYSIKDVGYAVGYANLSNFTLAFKKQFNQLPSDLLK
ncbi:MAG: helix-turn-helix transcriptional regulator [Bacteroidetes bacterium]|nr:helix-turn-helix transcriptional regulator [Bacteroidota bacterium]